MEENNKVFPEIETERLLLRQLTFIDLKDLYEIFSKEDIMKYYGMFPLKELEGVEKLISGFNKGFEDNMSIRWGIELKSTKKIIGTLGYHNFNHRFLRAEMGYELSNNYWNHGYMKEAISSIIDFGFKSMNLNRIEALVYPENVSSRNLLKNLKFKEEGILREYAYFREKYEDLVMYSLLKREIL
ncbi:GNAT family N-acetyltransferase [Clostridium hydrogeniformans]|uniref:GNAT family N-acetyltransferase n=1 Tax=Clostridium hydrogeniformans TaxID=349933 RepID=UPI0004879DC5|nr:GNAT family protein [Clostridium hydrogeniformans]